VPTSIFALLGGSDEVLPKRFIAAFAHNRVDGGNLTLVGVLWCELRLFFDIVGSIHHVVLMGDWHAWLWADGCASREFGLLVDL
jgi:hypothetical protein